jgi:hypothetical protein
MIKKRKEEKIYDWIERIARALNMSKEQKEAMREVAMESYIKGSNDAYEVCKTYNENEKTRR